MLSPLLLTALLLAPLQGVSAQSLGPGVVTQLVASDTSSCFPTFTASQGYFVKSDLDTITNGTTGWTGWIPEFVTVGSTEVEQLSVVGDVNEPSSSFEWYFSVEGGDAYTVSTAVPGAPHIDCISGAADGSALDIVSCATSTSPPTPVESANLPFIVLCTTCSSTGGQNCLFVSNEFGGCIVWSGDSQSVTMETCDWEQASGLWTVVEA